MTRQLRFESLESRRLLAVSPLGDVISAGTYLLNTQQTFSQCRSPTVAMDAAGNITTVWASLEQDGSGWGVFARQFDSQGLAQGTEFQVNSTTTGAQTFPSVAMDDDGDFVVTWSSLGQDGSSYGVYARCYDEAGQPLGDEFRVNSWRAGNQNFSAVAMDADGDFVVTWTGADQDGDRTGIFGRRFDATGEAIRGEFLVNSTTDGNQRYSTVAMDADGAFVVTWTSDGQDGSSGGIYGQRFDANGQTLGDEFLVNTTTDGNQQLSSVSMTTVGDFLVAWQGFDLVEGKWNAFAQSYQADGAARGDELLLGSGRYVSVAMGESTDFTAVWRLDDPTGGDASQLHMGHFDPFGDPLNPYYTVGSSVVAHSAASTALAADRMVVLWTGESTISGESDVLLQRLDVSLPVSFNRPPDVSPISNQTIVEGQTLSFAVNAIDPNSPPDALTFRLESGSPTGAAIDPATGQFTWTPTEADGPGRYAITVCVEDDGLPPLTANASFEVLVIERNETPELSPVADQTVDEGSAMLLSLVAADADLPTQTLAYSLVSGSETGALVDPSTGDFTWTPGEEHGPGQYTFEVSVADDAPTPGVDTASFVVTVVEVNAGVTLQAVADQSLDQGETLTLTALADDPDLPAGNLVFSLDSGAPAGAVIDPVTGVFTWPTDASVAFGDYSVTVRVVDDGDPSAEDSQLFQITVEPPMLDPVADQTVDEKSLLTFQAVATAPFDPADPTAGLSFSLDPGAPSGASIDPVSGQFSWTPNELQGPGEYPITIRLSDDQTPAASDSESFTVTVLEVNDSPTLAAIADVVVPAGAPIHVPLRGADPDGDPLVFSVTGDNPDIVASFSDTNRSMRITVADFGQMTFELFETRAPDVTARIVELAESGFYEGVLFHRVASDAAGVPFVIQGGDPTGTGRGGSGTSFDDQFHPDLRHTVAGTLSMAHSGDDTNDSQFFITGSPTRHLDFNHSVFGFQTDGEDVRTAIEAVNVDAASRPFNNVVIESIEVFLDPNGGALMIQAPLGATGEGDITVTVSDGLGGTSQQTFHVTIQPDSGNSEPYLLTPADVETTVDTPVSFTLQANDVDDDPVYFSAEITPANANVSVTIDETSGQVTVTPSGGVTGVYELALGVGTAAGQDSDTQSVPLLIRPGSPSGLTLSADSDTGVSSSDRLTRFNATLGAPLQFHLDGLLNGAVTTVYVDGQPLGQAIASGGAAIVVSDGAVTLSDGDHLITAVQTLANRTLSVGNRNETVDLASVSSAELAITVDTVGPVFTSSSVETAQRGVAYLYDAETDDESTATVTYELATGPDGMTMHATTGRIDWPAPDSSAASESVVVRATDTAGNTVEQSFTITLSDVPVIDWLDPISDRSAEELSLLTFTATATQSGAPAAAAVFTLDASAPSGASIDPDTGVFTWSPSESQGPGSYPITVRVTEDGSSAVTDATTFTVDVTEVNAPPSLGPIADQTVEELSPLTFTATVADVDRPANALSFTLDTGAPVGASIDPGTGVFTWTPIDSQGPGAHSVTIRVTDDGSPALSDAVTFTVNVTEGVEENVAPAIDPIVDQTIAEGNLLTFIATAADANLPADALTFTLDPGAPAGASIDPGSGVFTWTPLESQGPGSYSVSVRVTDDGSPALSDATSFTVNVTELNVAPTVDPIADQTTAEGSLLTFIATAADANLSTDSLVFTLDAGAPVGASVDPTTGVFTWTPTESQGPGSYSVTLRATDDASPPASGITTFTVDVTEQNVAPTLGPIDDFTVFTGETFTTSLAATDSDLPQNVLVFSLEPGSPTGMEVDADTGVITWTPATDYPLGDSLVTVRVTDDGPTPLSTTQSFTVTRAGQNVPPSLDPVSDRMIVRGETLSFLVTTNDPGDRLVYRLDSGPAGASIHLLSGLFRWTPMENQPPGLYDVTIRVNDDGVPSLQDTVTFRVLLMEPASGGSNDIGVVELAELPPLAVDGQTRLTFLPTRTGQISGEAFFSIGGGDVDLTLFDANGSIVATSFPTADGCRLDGPVEFGQSYELAINGANPSVALRLANLLVDEGGGSVVVHGTAGDDTFQFTAGGPHEVTVDGVLYELDPLVTSSIRIVGGSGNDVITLHGTSDVETVEFWPGFAAVVLVAGDVVSAAAAYRIDAIEMTTIVVHSGGGADLSVWNDSPGDDRLDASPNSTQMTGDGFDNRAVGFRNVTATSSGGHDLAVFTDSPDNDTFTATPDGAKIEGPNFLAEAVQFERVIAYASAGGQDTALLYGRTDGDDLFLGDPNYSVFTGVGYYRRVRGFEETFAWGGPGGHDTARLTGSQTDDAFFGAPAYSELSGIGYLLRANDFAEVHARSIGGVNTATLNDSALADYLEATPTEVRLSNAELDYLCRVLRFSSVTAKSTHQNDNDVLAIDPAVDYLMLEGTW